MIDWLDFTIEINHPTIDQGGFMMFNHNGEIERVSDIFRRVQGSYTSTIGVKSNSIREYYSEVLFELSMPDGTPIYKGIDNDKTSSAISFYGNPTKYIQGHNVIGSDCVISIALALIRDVMPKLGLSYYLFEAEKKIIDGFFWVTRIDITHMFDLGSDKNVEDYLYMMPLTAKARGDRLTYKKGTFYVGQFSGLWSLKMYNKYKEITSRSKHHRLDFSFHEIGLIEFSKGKLRVELVLRKKQLKRLKMMNANILQKNLFSLYFEFLQRVTFTNQKANESKISELTNTYHSTYLRWLRGENPKNFLSHNVFYIHKRKLLECGIDISKPPINEEDRKVDIIPLTRILEPKIIKWSDIPEKILPTLIQPLEFKKSVRIA